MEYSFADNGWAVQIHTPVQELDEKDCKKIVELLIQHTLVYWKKQILTEQEIVDFSAIFGDHNYTVTNENHDARSSRAQAYYVDRKYSGLIRISGKEDENGYAGVFGHKEDLDWHIDKIYHPARKLISLLYGKEGTKHSVTKFCNSILAYDALSDDKKKRYQEMSIRFGMGRWRKDFKDEAYHSSIREMNKLPETYHKLVCTNPFGKKGLFISPLQTIGVSGMSHDEMIAFTEEMLSYLSQPQFVHSHDWDDGDLIMSDQMFGLHKRDHFENIKERVVYRIGMGYDRIYPNLKYEGYNGNL